MSLNMYFGEVQSQTQSMNAVCIATIQGMEQAIQSIDAFAVDTVLQGQTYSSAKAFFVQTFRPLAQGIIYLCEELIRQNDAFPSQFQLQVAQADVIEQEILEQIRDIDRMKASMEAISQAMPIPGMDAMANLFTVMRKKLQEKLEHLYEFNFTSSSNYDTALQLASSIATGLAEVQSGKGFSPASGTFSTQGLNMEWTTSIQAITESKARKAQIEKAIALREQEANRPWYEKTAISTWEFMKEFFQGAGSAAFESVIGLESPDNDELESKLTYQAGRFTGNVIAGAASIIEILEGLTVIGGSNFLTLVATVGTGGLASPIAITFDAAATTAGVSLVGHGVFVGRNAIQNSKDTLQKFQSSSNGSSGGVKKEVDNTFKATPKLENHIKNIDPSVPRRRGIGGAHNSEEFFKNDIKIVSESPSKIPGVKTVEYNMPKLNMDGTPTGEYGNKVFTKTIYDPKIISDKEFINRGIEAANDAKLKTSDGVLSREWTGVDSKEITWRGYHKDGEISSFFPE